MAAIDVGSAASDRASTYNLRTVASVCTAVDGNNAANDTGTIDTVEVWLSLDASDATDGGLWFGTFSDGGSNVLTCRDSEAVGTCSAGSKQTFTGLDIDIVTGDYIGAAHRGTDTCTIERDESGYTLAWLHTGECIDATDSDTFTAASGDAISLYGTGSTPGPTTYDEMVALDIRLRDTDSESVSLDVRLRDTDALAVLLDVILGGVQQTIALDALLRDTDSASVNLSALLRDVDWETVGLDALTVDRLIAAINLSALLRDTDSEAVNLSALIEATDSESIALDVILKDQTYNAPYYIEVRDPDGVLLGVIRDIIDGSLEQATNAPDVLSFTIPLNELRAQYLTRKNQIWVRDSATDSVISVCRIQMTEESD